MFTRGAEANGIVLEAFVMGDVGVGDAASRSSMASDGSCVDALAEASMVALLELGPADALDAEAGAITFGGFAELKYFPPPDLDEKKEYARRPAAICGSRRTMRDMQTTCDSENADGDGVGGWRSGKGSDSAKRQGAADVSFVILSHTPRSVVQLFYSSWKQSLSHYPGSL